MQTLVLADNGSKRPESTIALRRLAAALAKRLGRDVHPVSLQHSDGIPPERLGGRAADTLETLLRREIPAGSRTYYLWGSPGTYKFKMFGLWGLRHPDVPGAWLDFGLVDYDHELTIGGSVDPPPPPPPVAPSSSQTSSSAPSSRLKKAHSTQKPSSHPLSTSAI